MSTSGLAWFKSSYSGGSGDDCVEVALDWYKSSYSSGSGDDCVEVAHSWHKSSHSSSGDGDCVEVAWHKSSHSSGGSGDCVEVATCLHTVHVRDSKAPEDACLTLSPAAWGEFVSGCDAWASV